MKALVWIRTCSSNRHCSVDDGCDQHPEHDGSIPILIISNRGDRQTEAASEQRNAFLKSIHFKGNWMQNRTTLTDDQADNHSTRLYTYPECNNLQHVQSPCYIAVMCFENKQMRLKKSKQKRGNTSPEPLSGRSDHFTSSSWFNPAGKVTRVSSHVIIENNHSR